MTAVRLLPGPFLDAMAVNRRYVMGLDPDRLLHTFRLNAGLPSTAEPLGGWEAPENELIVRNDQFLALGLEPTTLSDGLLEEGTEIARRYRDRVDASKIISRSVWRKGMETAEDLVIKDLPGPG